MATKASNQITVYDLTDGASVMLSSDSVTFNGSTTTLGTQQQVTVNVSAYLGEEQVTPTVGTPVCPTNVTASVGAASNMVVPVTITFAAALSASGLVQLPVQVNDLTINKNFAFSIAFKGTGGSNATAYHLIVSAGSIAKSEAGAYTPSSVVLTGRSQTGTSSPANYAGRFKIEKTTNNSTWTSVYTSSANEATYTLSTIPADIIALRCSLYLAGGTTSLLDQRIVPIVNDGTDGDDGEDAITLVIISSNGLVFKNTAIATTLTAHVYKAGVEVTGTALTALGTIKWYKDGGSTAVSTGSSLTISAGDVTNIASYEARLEG